MVVIKARDLVGAAETGLGNELWTLVGFLLTARARNWTLCLPDFTTNVHHTATDRPIPYEELFDASALIGGMAQYGVRCARASDEMCRASNVTVNTHLHGWFAYKRGFNLQRSRLREGQVHPQQQFVEQVYRSIVLSGPIEAVVRATMAANRLKPGAYGCVHARAESDARRIAEAGGVPTMREYVGWARALAQRHTPPATTPVVYVATGDPLNVTAMNDLEQNATGSVGGLLSALASRAGGAHGARYRGVRWANSPYKTGFDATTLDRGMNVTYMFASLVDFSICRRAGWFLGCAARDEGRGPAPQRPPRVTRAPACARRRYGPSSFSRILAEYRKIDFGDGWYSACPRRPPRHYAADEINGSLYTHWTQCPQNCTALPPHVQMNLAKARGSFGYTVMCMHGTGPPEMQEPRHHHHHHPEAEWLRRTLRRRRAR